MLFSIGYDPLSITVIHSSQRLTIGITPEDLLIYSEKATLSFFSNFRTVNKQINQLRWLCRADIISVTTSTTTTSITMVDMLFTHVSQHQVLFHKHTNFEDNDLKDNPDRLLNEEMRLPLYPYFVRGGLPKPPLFFLKSIMRTRFS